MLVKREELLILGDRGWILLEWRLRGLILFEIFQIDEYYRDGKVTGRISFQDMSCVKCGVCGRRCHADHHRQQPKQS